MFRKLNFSLLITLFFCSLFSVYAQDDMDGSKDHPMISRYEGAYIQGYEHYEYDRLTFFAGEKNDEIRELVPEGEVTRILYFLPPEGLSVLQVQRNYQQALKDAGFEMVYACFGGVDEIPREIYRDFDHIEGEHGNDILNGKDQSYFMARLPQEDGDVFVSAHTWISDYADADQQPVTALQILEEKPMETGKVNVELDAETMADDIEKTGSVRIYGIYFDTGKATVQEESESTLAEIASLLKQRKNLQLAVVGHTDATGDLEQNMDLSVRRAEAVVESLTTNHAISEERLTPYGVGPLVPVASNDEEDDRARNRRVELVKMPATL